MSTIQVVEVAVEVVIVLLCPPLLFRLRQRPLIGWCEREPSRRSGELGS